MRRHVVAAGVLTSMAMLGMAAAAAPPRGSRSAEAAAGDAAVVAAAQAFLDGLRAGNAGRLGQATSYPFTFDTPSPRRRCERAVADPVELLDWLRCMARYERALLGELRARAGIGGFRIVELEGIESAALRDRTARVSTGDAIVVVHLDGAASSYELVFRVESRGPAPARPVVRAFLYDADVLARL